MSTPHFPAIAIDPESSFSVVPSKDFLQAGSRTAIRAGYFQRLHLFDSRGSRWRVAAVEPTSERMKGPFGELICVRLTFGEADTVPVGDVAEELCRIVDADPDDLYDQFVTHEELKALLRSSRTPADLIAVALTLGAPD